MVRSHLLNVFCLLLVQGSHSLWTVTRTVAKKGQDLTIPCHYHKSLRDNVKYWCKGQNWLTCEVMVRSDSQPIRGRVSMADEPSQLLFTVTMARVEERDAGRYWCAVQRSRNPDIRTALEMAVAAGTPDLYVVSSTASGQEGGSVSIRCPYTEKFRRGEKKWCNSGDWHSCQKETEVSQNASVEIRDDRSAGVFAVTMRKLERKDADWYWCDVGGTQASVHITVSQRPPGHANTTAPQTTRPALPVTLSTVGSTHFHASTASPRGFTFQPMPEDSPPDPGSISTRTASAPSGARPSVAMSTPGGRCPSGAGVLEGGSETPGVRRRYPVWASLLIVCSALLLLVTIAMVTGNILKRHNSQRVREEGDELELNEEDRDLEENDWAAFLNTKLDVVS